MKRAFSLIEVMICIAILAIFMATEIPAWKTLTRLRRESDFRLAARNAQIQLVRLQKTPFEALPPQILVPDAQGRLVLGQKDIRPESLHLRALQGNLQAVTPLEFDAARGSLRVDPRLAGRALWADYEFFAADRDEAHIVPADLRVTLDNGPAGRVEAVWLAQGDALRKCNDWRLEPDRLGLRLGEATRGKVVVVDYRGSRTTTLVGGRYLDEALQPLDSPSPIKLLQIREGYGGVESMQVSSLRLNTP